MTDPVFHASPEQLATVTAGEELTITGAEARHMMVRRLRSGEALDLVDGAGTRVTCEFVGGTKESVTVRALSVGSVPEATPVLTLVQALAKGDRDLQAAESATELGVDRVIAWQAERSIVRLKAEREAKTMAKWNSTLAAAAKQSRRARWPRLGEPVDTTGLARLIQEESEVLWLVLHESASRSWGSVSRATLAEATSIGVVVGPEGGIGEDELGRLVAAGARPVKLGADVMRASTAGPAALAALCAVTGRWN